MKNWCQDSHCLSYFICSPLTFLFGITRKQGTVEMPSHRLIKPSWRKKDHIKMLIVRWYGLIERRTGVNKFLVKNKTSLDVCCRFLSKPLGSNLKHRICSPVQPINSKESCRLITELLLSLSYICKSSLILSPTCMGQPSVSPPALFWVSHSLLYPFFCPVSLPDVCCWQLSTMQLSV